MKQDSFTKMMNQISAEADAEKLAEIKAEQRRARWVKVRKAALVLVLVGAGTFAYLNRADLGQQWNKVVAKSGLGDGKSLTGYKEAGAKLEGKVGDLQATATKRNELVDEITRNATGK